MEKENSKNLPLGKAERVLEDDPLFRKLEEIRRDYDSRLSALTLNLPGFEKVETRKDYFSEETSIPIETPSLSPALPSVVSTVGIDPAPLLRTLVPSSEQKEDLPVRSGNLPLFQESQETPAPLLKKELRLNYFFTPFYLSVIGVFISFGIAFWIWNIYVSSSWIITLPFKNPIGLALSGDSLLTFDSQDSALYSFSSHSGQLEKKNSFSCDHSAGFAAFQKNIWCAEESKKDLQRYIFGDDGNYDLKRVYPMDGAQIGPLYSDGDYLWGADSGTGRIFQYLIVQSLTGTLLTPIDRFNLPDVYPSGLYVSKNILWVLDLKSRRILRYKLSVLGPKPLDSFDLSGKIKENVTVSGFATDGETLWVSTHDPSQIHRFELKNLPHLSLALK